MTASVRISHWKVTDTVQRFADLLLAAMALVALVVPMLIIAAAIRLDDRGPVLFRQQRIGRNRKPFQIYKFRTMTVDRNRPDGRVNGKVDASQRARFETTVPNDPRITRVGRVLRPIHLDELPQVLNVLLGDMSFVGVRPDVPVQEADYTEQEWIDRHILRPGITGVAQVSGAVDSMKDRTELDLYWVQHRSLGIYFNVLGKTLHKVLMRNSL